MFRRTIRSVVPMDYKMLAEKDGSEQAEGRGSGLEPPPEQKPKPFPRTPYLNMIYAPIERRLDTAIFRALFASSTRQARQFVVHGYVRVNGKKVIMVFKLFSSAQLTSRFADDLPRISIESRRHVPSGA